MSKAKEEAWKRTAKKAVDLFVREMRFSYKPLGHSAAQNLYFGIADLTAALGLLSEDKCKAPLGQVYEDARDVIKAIKKGSL